MSKESVVHFCPIIWIPLKQEESARRTWKNCVHACTQTSSLELTILIDQGSQLTPEEAASVNPLPIKSTRKMNVQVFIVRKS